MPIDLKKLTDDANARLVAEIRAANRSINHDTADGSRLRLDGELPAIDPAPKLSSKPPRKMPVLGHDAFLSDEERARPEWQRPLGGELIRRAQARSAEQRDQHRRIANDQITAKATRSK